MRNKEVFATDMAKDLISSWFAFCSVCKERLLLKCTCMGAWGDAGNVVIVPVPANFNYKVKMRLKLTGDSDPIMDIQIRIQTKSVLTIIDRDNFCIPLFIKIISILFKINLSLGFFLKIFLNFANFSLEILIKYILKKKKSVCVIKRCSQLTWLKT